MMKHMLWHGMLAGILGAVVAATFALIFAEPRIDAAIAFEAAHAVHAMPGMDEDLVSRTVQKTAGLFTAMLMYGTALGGLFAIVFAVLYGRVVRIGPRSLSLLLALLTIVVIVVVPAIKYPPTPPAVGLHETVRLRTVAYFGMIGFSVLAAVAGIWIRQRLSGRWSAIDAILAGVMGYVVLVAALQLLLPTIDEVPATFPASLLWQFRVASIATQTILFLVIGIAFGWQVDRILRDRRTV
ncbi:CbtA family protein [Sphingomonas sp. PB2P12]|uniref:CbtA family protein n=1 Tax=Sphingomonas sandaracina TaxID=3096157 RepID=UPI002FC842DC